MKEEDQSDGMQREIVTENNQQESSIQFAEKDANSSAQDDTGNTQKVEVKDQNIVEKDLPAKPTASSVPVEDAEITEIPFQTRFDEFCTEISKGNLEFVSKNIFTVAELDCQNSDGKTPLILSIVFDCPKITEFLLQKGVSVSSKVIFLHNIRI